MAVPCSVHWLHHFLSLIDSFSLVVFEWGAMRRGDSLPWLLLQIVFRWRRLWTFFLGRKSMNPTPCECIMFLVPNKSVSWGCFISNSSISHNHWYFTHTMKKWMNHILWFETKSNRTYAANICNINMLMLFILQLIQAVYTFQQDRLYSS